MKRELPSVSPERAAFWHNAIKRADLIKKPFDYLYKDTALTNPTVPWDESDVGKSLQLLEFLFSVGHERVSETLPEHSVQDGLLRRKIAEALNQPDQLDPIEAQVLGNLDDAPRVVIPHLYLLTNVAGDNFSRKVLGIRPDLLKKNEPVGNVLTFFSPSIDTLEEESVAVRAAILSDNFARLGKRGIFTQQEYRRNINTFASRYAQDPNVGVDSILAIPDAMSRAGVFTLHYGERISDAQIEKMKKELTPEQMNRILREKMKNGRAMVSKQITLAAIKWFEGETGVPFAKVKRAAYEQYRDEGYADWVVRVREQYFPYEKRSANINELLKQSDE